MANEPWLGDACSLVDALRAGECSPLEALEACLAAAERSNLNAFSYLDHEAARKAASEADVGLPFGGVPVAVKELDHVAGWPHSEASVVFADRKSAFDATMVARLRAAGCVLAGQTTASEFGGVNCTSSKLHGTTRNPWDLERTPGGSSGGSAAAVAGGIIPVATAGDGGGSIRIPAGFTGTFGLKSTFGRIPKGPQCSQTPHTVTLGCISRSVRDTARWFDICSGFDPRDTLSLPSTGGWEADLGTLDLAGKKVAVVPDLGVAVVNPACSELVEEAAKELALATGMVQVPCDIHLPEGGMVWAMSGLVSLLAELGDRYPGCVDDLTPEIQIGLNIAEHHYDLATAAEAERFRTEANEAMADIFDSVDLVISCVNPDVAFDAAGPLRTTVGGRELMGELGFEKAIANNGALTIPANLTGNPAVSIPIGFVDNLPVGMQVLGRHHEEPVLLDIALAMERIRPWPLVVPGSPI